MKMPGTLSKMEEGNHATSNPYVMDIGRRTNDDVLMMMMMMMFAVIPNANKTDVHIINLLRLIKT